MQFQTTLRIEPQKNHLIDYNSKLLFIGSCFAENIGNVCEEKKFNVVQNPFGILFHPLAVENIFKRAVNEDFYTKNDTIEINEVICSLEAHSKLNALTKEALVSNLNTALIQTRNRLLEASHIFITLGTAWVYRYTKTNTIVANCHKIPQKYFQKEILSVSQISNALASIVKLIKSVNKETKIIFTVSPVRHLKDGFIENNRSKSHLITALHQILEHNNNINYFPAYEIMIDELRDYRFYKNDMLHPNDLAIQVIWKKLLSVWFSKSSVLLLNRIEKVNLGLKHVPFNINSNAHKLFLKNLKEEILKIELTYSHIKF